MGRERGEIYKYLVRYDKGAERVGPRRLNSLKLPSYRTKLSRMVLLGTREWIYDLLGCKVEGY